MMEGRSRLDSRSFGSGSSKSESRGRTSSSSTGVMA